MNAAAIDDEETRLKMAESMGVVQKLSMDEALDRLAEELDGPEETIGLGAPPASSTE